VFIAGGTGGSPGDGQAASAGQGLLGLLLSLLVAEKSGFTISEPSTPSPLQEVADKMAKQALEAMQGSLENATVPAAPSSAGNGNPAEVPTPITPPPVERPRPATPPKAR
jgi:hypothetical protein